MFCLQVQVAPHLLEWPARAPLILNEILDSRADLVCLQELNHYGAAANRLEGSESESTLFGELYVGRHR